MNIKRTSIMLALLLPFTATISSGLENGELLLQDPTVAATQDANLKAVKKIDLDIVLDTKDAPDMAKWAAEAKDKCVKAYPLILEHLGAPSFKPPQKVTIVFKKMKGIAYCAGNTITCGESWFQSHPDDYGAVIHELCHVVQAYGRQRVPGWVTEGIADYVRWFQWEPANRRPRVNPNRAKYTDSYQTTAAFFDWIVRTKDKTFVKRLNVAARNGKYQPQIFQELTGQPVEKLWEEFIGSMKKK